MNRLYPNFGVGLPEAIPAVGDWDGTGVTRIGVYWNGSWYLDKSGDGAWSGTPNDITYPNFGVGLSGSIPVVGDWDGIGVTRIGEHSILTSSQKVQKPHNSLKRRRKGLLFVHSKW